MPGSTTELNLKTAVDSDDNADYLTLSLADSLRTLDALFHATTGHNHSGAHQGGAISPTALQPPMDLPGVYRSTSSAGLPNTGVGLEMYFDTGLDAGVVQAFNRNATLYKPLRLLGSEVQLATGGTPRWIVQSTGTLWGAQGSGIALHSSTGEATIVAYGRDGAGTELVGLGGLTVTPGAAYFASAQVNGNMTVAGSETITLDLTVSRNVGVANNLTADSLNARVISASGTVAATGAMAGSTFTANSGVVYFESSNQVMIRWAPANTRLEVPYGNGLWASQIVSAGMIHASGANYGNPLRCLGSNTFLAAISGEGVAFLNTTPGSMLAQVAINEANGHSKLLWVNGAAGGTMDWQRESSERIKRNITPIPVAQAYELLRDESLSGLSYNRIDQDDRHEYGFSADAWHPKVPEVVGLDEGVPHTMAYSGVIPFLWTALADMAARLDALEAA